MTVYPWSAFDVDVVRALLNQSPGHVNTATDGGLRCPLIGHEAEWLEWHDGSARNGTVWHSAPELRFHASPTYVLRDPLDNFIVGRDLVRNALEGGWGKAETHRLGHENSEDALTWNVFRSLQEADALGIAVRVLADFAPQADTVLYLWGRRIDAQETARWEELAAARNEIEPWGGQQTEPDCCIHVPGQAWIFIEAKFGSRTTTKTDERSRDAWIDRYDETCPGLFNRAVMAGTPPQRFPEQLLRNVALASRIRQADERVSVVALVRHADSAPVEEWAQECLADPAVANIRRCTWEDLYEALPLPRDLDPLRHYLEGKSFRLQKAFALGVQAVTDESHRLAVAAAIEALPETEKLVISMAYYEELSNAEIATVLGASEKEVAALHESALLRLAEAGVARARPSSRIKGSAHSSYEVVTAERQTARPRCELPLHARNPRPL